MKKISVLAVLLIAAAAFTACGNDDTPAEDEIRIDTISEEVSEAYADDGEEDILEDDDSDLEDYFPDLTERTDDDPENEANPLMPIIDKVLSESEWPVMEEIKDEFILNEFFLLDVSNENYREMIVMQCPVSAVMSEIIIIKAEDVQQAQSDLEARRTKAVEQDAWYPNDIELAEASIVGTNGSYAYFIIGENAAAAEGSVNDYINAA
ncbi:MAG: DUF4358 domain-containing protein [Ruminococcus sp.]|nr:DUF4358 domain-containing protein [Ruminococcus sp.]